MRNRRRAPMFAAIVILSTLAVGFWMAGQVAASAPTKIPLCLVSNLREVVGSASGAGQELYYDLQFRNGGRGTCELTGTPTAQPVVGSKNLSIGPPATKRHVNGRGGTVRLFATGVHRIASVVFGVQSAAGRCAKVRYADGVDILFSSKLRFHFSIRPYQVCLGLATTDIFGISPGTRFNP